MLAVSQGRIIAASTPFGMKGWWFEAWRSTERWERYRVPTTDFLRISPQFLAEQERTMSRWEFLQEYMLFLRGQ